MITGPIVLTNHRMIRVGPFWQCTFCGAAAWFGVPGAATPQAPCRPRLWSDQEPIPQTDRKVLSEESANDWPCPTCGVGPNRKCRSLRVGVDAENAHPHPARRYGGGK